jgi:hypothetical protein
MRLKVSYSTYVLWQAVGWAAFLLSILLGLIHNYIALLTFLVAIYGLEGVTLREEVDRSKEQG